MNYLSILDEAFDAAERAFQRLRSSGGAAQPLTRGAFGDLTYRIDKEIEDAIIEVVRRRLPRSLIVSEEAGALGDPDDRPLVLIDPVDGSTNASRGVPFYSSAIAIVDGYRFGDVAAAGVFDLVHRERIVSGGGGNVTIDGRSAHPSSTRSFDEAYVNVNMRSWKPPKGESHLAALLRRIRYPRFLGSAALETTYVAIGRSDAFVQLAPNLRTFDCIGALYLVQEAGGWLECLNADIESVDLRGSVRFAYIAACDAEMGKMVKSVRD
jgi:myo-inositol-1(or 4)-monophosphatase